MRFLIHVPEIRADHSATLLQPLADGGGLYLTRDAALAEVRPSAAPEIVDVRLFRGGPEWIWAEAQAYLPEVEVGVSLTRFWLCTERASLGGAVLYGVLDLRAMDVLERGAEHAVIRARVARANANPRAYLREIARDRVPTAVAAAMGSPHGALLASDASL